MIQLKSSPSVYVVFFIFFTLFSCKNDEVQLPIPKDKMVNVLVEIHMSEAYVETINTTLKDSMAKQYYPQVFKHNGITAKMYDSAFSVLSNHPRLMKAVYDDVLLKIEERQKIMRGDTIQTIKTDTTKKN